MYGEITDKSNSSVDSYEIQLCEESFEENISFPINFDIIRLLTASGCNEHYRVEINTDTGYCTFANLDPTNSAAYKLKYIVPGLQS